MEKEKRGKGKGGEGSGDSTTKKNIKCVELKTNFYGRHLMSARHTRKMWRMGKHVRGHTTETSLPHNYLPLYCYKLKSKLHKLTK